MIQSLLLKMAGSLAVGALPSTKDVVKQVKVATKTGRPSDLIPKPNYTLLALAGLALAASFWVANKADRQDS